MPLIIPNGIENLTPADATELQQNNDAIQQYINTDVIQRDGSVGMNAPLLLVGAPTQTNQACNKGYADTKLAKDGSVAMTGVLTLDGTDGTGLNAAMRREWIVNQLATKVDNHATQALDMNNWKIFDLQTPNAQDGPQTAVNKEWVSTGYVAKDGAAMTPPGQGGTGLRMNGTPVWDLPAPGGDNEATRKLYVDTQVATALSKSGGTMSGQINCGGYRILNVNMPTANSDAATKQYVDNKVAALQAALDEAHAKIAALEARL
jgi:hypothetical protein